MANKPKLEKRKVIPPDIFASIRSEFPEGKIEFKITLRLLNLKRNEESPNKDDKRSGDVKRELKKADALESGLEIK